MRRVFILLLAFISFFGFFRILPSYAQAPSPGAGIVITLSEVSPCEDNGWIELYNESDQGVDVSTWKVEEKGKDSSTWTPKTLVADTATISAKLYKQFNVGSNFLSNEEFSLRLKDGGGDVLEENTFEKCPTPRPVSWIKQGTSWSLTTAVTPGQANTLVSPSTPTPTPTPTSTTSPTSTPTTTAGPTPTPTTQPITISLSEIYACQADGSKEWVELYNSGATTVTLTNWKLTDHDNNEQPIATLAISAKGYSTVEISKYARGMLTDSGDVVNLIDGTGKKVDTYEYKECHTDQTWAKSGGGWQETTQMTKGSANPSLESSTSSAASDSASLEADDGAESGEVLGSSDEEPSPTPTPSPKPSSGNGQTMIAIGSIVVGLLVLGSIGGYFGWEWWKKRKKKKL
ncbi:MAG: lamin tail domain-containing protein [Candidatus Woesebacteria bacterium]